MPIGKQRLTHPIWCKHCTTFGIRLALPCSCIHRPWPCHRTCYVYRSILQNKTGTIFFIYWKKFTFWPNIKKIYLLDLMQALQLFRHTFLMGASVQRPASAHCWHSASSSKHSIEQILKLFHSLNKHISIAAMLLRVVGKWGVFPHKMWMFHSL